MKTHRKQIETVVAFICYIALFVSAIIALGCLVATLIVT